MAMPIMTKTIHPHNTSWPITLSMILLLFIGIIISATQIQNKRTLISRADNTVNCAVDANNLTITTQEQNLLTLINNYRAQHGLNPLTFSKELIRAATWMSNDMLIHNYLNHTDSLGRIFSDRIQACGYTNFLTMGENIDSGDPDSLSTFNAWSHSPPHNTAMLNPDFTEAGISLAFDASADLYYWTLDLGSRSSSTIPTSTPAQATPTISGTPPATYTPSPTLTLSPTVIKQPTLTPTITPTPLPTKPFTPTATPTPSNTPTPTMPPGFVQNPQDMQIFVLAKIKGIGLDGNKNPKERTRHVTVTIYDSKNKEVTSGNGFIIYDGTDLFGGIIHFGPIKNDTYYIKIIADRMLQTTVKPIFQILDSSRLNMLPKVTLIQGDINDDNAINIADYNLALSCFQDKKCENKNLIDFNNDNLANVIDYNLLLQNYWESLGD